VHAIVPFEACVEAWAADETIEGFMSPATGTRTTAVKRTRFATFPQYLVLQMRRYVVGPDWQPRKLDALVSVPEQLDLGTLRSVGGLQAGEEPLLEAESAAPAAPKKAEADPVVLASLVSMGFPEHKARRAAIATGNRNLDAAAEWLLSHLDDPDDAADPTPPPEAPAVAAPPPPPPTGEHAEEVATLMAMGFTERAVRRAFSETKNDMNRAADWLLSHADELAEEAASEPQPAAPARKGPPPPLFPKNEMPSKYELVAFISHIGKATQSGHYVAHIKKDGRWILFNDEKVAISEDPPRDLGYLYFFRRL
jgi:ubiquitin carboxyl-terminal hydrolase 5/13